MTTTVCVDAMGGDERPEVVLEGIAQALAADSDLTVLVAGDEDVVVPFCASHDRARALVTTEIIGMGEHPTDAVRSKRDSSIVQGCLAVRHGDADGFFAASSALRSPFRSRACRGAGASCSTSAPTPTAVPR